MLVRSGIDLAHGFVERDAADGVLLPQQQVGQAAAAVAAYSYLFSGPAAVLHAGRDVDEQGAAEVGVFFVLLDVEPVLLGPDLPIDVAQVVAGGVFAVLQELDDCPKYGLRCMPVRKPSTMCRARSSKPADALDRLRMQKSFGIGRRGSVRLRWWG